MVTQQSPPALSSFGNDSHPCLTKANSGQLKKILSFDVTQLQKVVQSRPSRGWQVKQWHGRGKLEEGLEPGSDSACKRPLLQPRHP